MKQGKEKRSPLVSWEVAKEYLLPEEVELHFMGEVYLDIENVSRVGSYHAIGKDGVLVCECKLNPYNHVVWPHTMVEPQYRYAMCEPSKLHLRKLVTVLLERVNHVRQRDGQVY